MSEILILTDTAVKQNVQKKNVKDKKIGDVGEIAHYHPRDDETQTWDEACVFVKHYVRDEAGLVINDKVYKGTVIVPVCVANYLNQMEQAVEQAEIGLFRANSKNKIVGQL